MECKEPGRQINPANKDAFKQAILCAVVSSLAEGNLVGKGMHKGLV